jgi:short-subunit dehydrogenase
MSQKVCAIVGFGTGVSKGVARAFGQEGYALALIARTPAKLVLKNRLSPIHQKRCPVQQRWGFTG